MIDWPTGRRAIVDEHGTVENLDDQTPVDYWVCCRLDQPWTWRVLSNQHTGQCTRCGAGIIYRITERSPREPAVLKICRSCAERMVTSTEDAARKD